MSYSESQYATMDYHFILPDDDDHKPRKKSEGSGLWALVKKLTPIFVLSAILPLFIFFVASPPEVSYFTRASEAADVRIWIEPTQIVAKVGTPVRVTVFASSTADSLISSLEVPLVAEDVLLNDYSLEYSLPFKGQIVVGEVMVTPLKEGTYQIGIDESNVHVNTQEVEAAVTAASANLYVK